jgi:hypothetical protein
VDFYAELSSEQRRQLVDAQQLFGAWRGPFMDLESMGSLTWNTSKDRRYLRQKVRGITKSLGRESEQLHKFKREHAEKKKALKARVKSLEKRLDQTAPVNRAIGIGHMPTIAARIIRELDREGLLGSHIIVSGTNALYGYEVACGVRIGGAYVATGDADLLWDTRQSLLLTGTGVRRRGLMDLLRRVDESFVADYGYNATNRDGYIVDLLCAESDDFTTLRRGADLEATAMVGAEWLLGAPQLEQVIVGADGIPLRIVTPEPRTYALHKLWVSQQESRTELKKPRDREHSKLVAELCTKYLQRSFVAKDMPWLSAPLKALIKDVGGTKEPKAT